MKLMALPSFFLLIMVLTSCSALQDAEDRSSRQIRNTGFPDLVPIETIVGIGQLERADPQTQAVLEARVARLKARAARLKRSVIDPNSRNRLSQKPAVLEPS